MSKYDEMRNFYEERIISMRNNIEYHERHIDRLLDEIRDVREKNVALISECAEKAAKIEMYEMILARLLGDNKNCTDEIFTFRGNHYRATSFNLECGNEPTDILTVEFEKVFVFDQQKGENA